MNGTHIKQAAIQKAKQVASASNSSNSNNGNATKKRKKELKPIITTDGPPDADADDLPSIQANSSSVG
jgi:hypothetical protein